MGMTVNHTLTSQTGTITIDLGPGKSNAYNYQVSFEGATTFTVEASAYNSTEFKSVPNGTGVTTSELLLIDGWLGQLQITPGDGSAYTVNVRGGNNGDR
jgi:hypothetical protein